MENEIKGIDYHVHPKPDAHMFAGNGYIRQRAIAGRGREKTVLNVRYDKQYPADLINEILLQVIPLFACKDDYESWYRECILSPSDMQPKTDSKLDSVKATIAKYKAESQQSPRWDKANKLITELDSILGDSNE